MNSYSTTLVLALALLPSAFSLDTTLLSTFYSDSECKTESSLYYAVKVDAGCAGVDGLGVCTSGPFDGGYNKQSCVGTSLSDLTDNTIGYKEYSDATCTTLTGVGYSKKDGSCTSAGTNAWSKVYYNSAWNEVFVESCITSSCDVDDCEQETYSTECTVSDDDSDKYTMGYDSISSDVCFSGDDTLTLESGAAKRFSEVAIGDKVQTADAKGVLSFSEVVALPHAANNKLASFVNVATASGKVVKATKMHLLQQCDGSLAYAGSLAVGDCLRTVDGDEAVDAVSMTTAEGIYTAVTNNEFLVVNGIVASPFAVTHGLTNAYYNVHRLVAKVFPSALKSPLVLAANAFLGGAFLTSGGSK